MSKQPIDVILTSCGRFELLEQTLDSFFKYVDWPINNFIVYEDKGVSNQTDDDKAWIEYLTDKYESIIWYFGIERIGQICAIDFLMAKVTTEYFAHWEDDWETLRTGFIEASMNILEKHPFINQVQLRGEGNINGHPSIPYPNDPSIKVLARNYNGKWHGFGFNPSLRRLKDYKLIHSYSEHAVFKPTAPWESEAVISKLYKMLGCWTATLPTAYLVHIGDKKGIRR